jgi:hypothetical protein
LRNSYGTIKLRLNFAVFAFSISAHSVACLQKSCQRFSAISQ